MSQLVGNTEAFVGVGHGLAMVGNAATLHQTPLDGYVDDLIERNGGAYAFANVSANVGVAAAYLATGLAVYEAAGGATWGFALKSGASRLGPIPLPHVTFAYGTGGNLTWAHGLGNGFYVTTGLAGPGGYITTVTGIPILAPGAIGAWVATQPNCTSCAHSAIESFLRGWLIIR